MILNGKKLDSSNEYFKSTFHYKKEKNLKNQIMYLVLRLLPIKFDIKGKIPKEDIKIGMSHDTIKNHLWILKVFDDIKSFGLEN